MDRHLPPAVTYWTGVWDPGREALSKEVASLRGVLAPGAPVVSFSAGNRSAWPRRSVWKLSGRHWIALRALAAWLERRGEVTHVFGAIDSWHLLRALGRRPVVFTAAIAGKALALEMYRHVAEFAAESEPLAAALIAAGLPAERVHLVYPGIDLDQFRPVPLPGGGPFRLLFASTPSDAAELEGRGVPLLVEVARRVPDVEVVLLWRTWGDADAARRALAKLEPPANVRVEHREASDMAAVYASVHAVACLFSAEVGKSAPNSIIEGLACGRPALVSDACGLAALIEREGAGVASPRRADDVAANLLRLRDDHAAASSRSRALAEARFGFKGFCEAYRGLYERAVAQA